MKTFPTVNLGRDEGTENWLKHYISFGGSLRSIHYFKTSQSTRRRGWHFLLLRGVSDCQSMASHGRHQHVPGTVLS